MSRKKAVPLDQIVLSRRERQIMELLFRLGPLTVAQTRKAIPDPPTYSGVRALFRVLLNKGYVRCDQRGIAYVYKPAQSIEAAGEKALAQLIETFFHGSPGSLVTMLFERRQAEFGHADLQRLRYLIERKMAEQVTDAPDRRPINRATPHVALPNERLATEKV